MAKKENFMLKTVVGATDLSLTAKTGESLLIKDILIYNPVSNYLTAKIEKTSVGYFRVGGTLGSHLPLPVGNAGHSHNMIVAAANGSLTEDHAISDAYGISNPHLAVVSDRSALTTETNVVQFGNIPNVRYQSLLSTLFTLGIFKGYPVAEGETFLLSGVNQAGSIQIVVYEKYDAGDITNVMDNGSASTKYFYVNYGRVAANVVASGDTQYTASQNPAEFPDFPFGKTVPAKNKITIHGILGSDVVDDRGSNDNMATSFLKLVKDRVILFDDDRNGLIMKGIIGSTDDTAQIGRGVSLIGNSSSIDLKPAFMFPEALEFVEGEELNVFVTAIAGASQSASDLLIADLELGLIATVERI